MTKSMPLLLALASAFASSAAEWIRPAVTRPNESVALRRVFRVPAGVTNAVLRASALGIADKPQSSLNHPMHTGWLRWLLP